MYATAVGLVIMGLNDAERSKNKLQKAAVAQVKHEPLKTPVQPTKKKSDFITIIKDLFQDDEDDKPL